MTLKILFIGDIMGKPGRKAVKALLPNLKETLGIDAVIANAENLAHGKGVSQVTLDEILSAGVDFCTSGNHIWSKNEAIGILEQKDSILIRPANYPSSNPGKGAKILSIGTKSILVVNLMGRVFMKENLDCPFKKLDDILIQYSNEPLAGIIVDFHAEVTSEKNAFGLYANGRVSAVLGTHTHIPTADERVLPKGTAYITDVGMVGIRDSMIGLDYEAGIGGYLTQMPIKHEIPDGGIVIFNSVLIEIDTGTGKATRIERIQRTVEV
ncbi:MAG: TIGR00282 family metallophosphoesterase [bacterium]|nr:TIGR00282 family metallophosphoesterase [bacterium]